MKAFSILLFACLAGQAQPAPQAPTPAFPDVPDATVIVAFDDGGTMTMGEFKKIYSILPPDAQQNFMKSPADFMRGLGVMRKLANMAKASKLEETSPAREQLEYYTMRILTDAEMISVNQHITVPPAEGKQYYDSHRDKYKEVRLKAIQLAFSDQTASSSSSTKSRSEEDAKALAAKLQADLSHGADFVKLVAQYSDDAASKAKDGDFTTIHATDNIPDEIRLVVLALKAGEVSQPIRQPTAIYLFRAEDVSYKPFEQVSDEIFAQLRMDQYRQWMEQVNRDTKVDFKLPGFFGITPPAVKPSGAH